LEKNLICFYSEKSNLGVLEHKKDDKNIFILMRRKKIKKYQFYDTSHDFF
jgi:hypothetical protein